MAQLVLYGSNVADATLTTACDMSGTGVGGVEASNTTTFTGVNPFAEIQSRGGTCAAVTALPSPTGQGWVYQPGAGTFDLGNWSGILTWASVNSPVSVTLRFSRYTSGGGYSTIGTIVLSTGLGAQTKTVYTFATTSMATVTFASGDFLYVDVWWFNNAANASGDNPTNYVSNNASAGVANDFQITTANFTASLGPKNLLYIPYAIPRALGGTIIPQVIKPPLIYTPHALGATLLTDLRIFIPRALGGVYIQDDPTEIWLPRIMAGTTQVASSVALSSTQHGIGTLAGTLTLATALTDTIPGLGVLTPTLTAKLDLGSATLVAIGVFTPASFTESTALTDTIPAVGVLSGTLLASLGLSATIPGVGTLTGTFTESTVLTVTIPAVGTLTGTLSTSTNVSLSVTIPAVGTLTMAGAALSTALTDTIHAVGSLNPALSASIALASTTIPAIGTITGTLGASAPLTSTVVGVGTINATLGESTSLTVSLSVVGTLTGTMTVGNSVSLAVTIPGVGTLTAAAPGFKTALVVSIAGLGTISPGATFSETLSGTTFVAVGTLSETISLAVILGTTLTGLGTLSGAFQVRTALSVQFMALGTILGTIRVPATFFGPYGATEVVSSKLTSSHTVTSKSSQHVASSYTATRK